MKKFLKRASLIFGGLIVVLGTLIVSLHLYGQHRLAQAPEVAVQRVMIPSDAASIARGKHLATAVTSCASCHAATYRGDVFMEGAPFGMIAAPNLTRGKGGIGTHFNDKDWVRAIRHGVGSDGRTLTLMPSSHYAHLSDTDLGALIAYMKSLPPVDYEPPATRIAFPGTIIFGVLAYQHMPVSIIDHHAKRPLTAPGSEGSVERGQYLTRVAACRECHGENLAGLTNENGPPPGPNLTPSGNLRDWGQADFLRAMRTGQTPDGRILNPKDMPWPGFSLMTDDELAAMFSYLQTIPAKALGDNNQ